MGTVVETVINKIIPRGTSTSSCPTFLDRVVQNLFPQHQERQHGTGLTEDIGAAEPTAVTESEVKIAAKKIAIRKAPGLDGVLALAIKTAALNVPYIFNDTFNACLVKEYSRHSGRHRGWYSFLREINLRINYPLIDHSACWISLENCLNVSYSSDCRQLCNRSAACLITNSALGRLDQQHR